MGTGKVKVKGTGQYKTGWLQVAASQHHEW